MRIAVNTRFLLPDRLEGIGYFTQEVGRRLVEQRPNDEFLFLFDRPYDQRFLFGPNVSGKSVFPPARHPLLWYAWFEMSLPRVLRSWSADVFFSPDGYCSLRSATPTVMVSHDIAHRHYPEQIPGLVRRYYDHFVPRYLKRAERVVTVSDFVKGDIIRHYGLPEEKISVACNGVKEEFRTFSAEVKAATRKRYANGTPYFFYLGAVHPRKNVARLITAYDRYRESGGSPAKLLLGGRLAWQTEDTRLAHQRAVHREDIQFLGYVEAEALPQLLGAAKALVYPSLSEGFGVPVLEAFHAEVPVITSKVTSLPEVAGEAALLVDPKEVEDITAAMLRLDREPELSTTLVATGRHQRQHFSWDRAVKVVGAAIDAIA